MMVAARTRSTLGGDEKYIQNFGRKIGHEDIIWDERMILKRILRKSELGPQDISHTFFGP
jgi:hypothetical protein